MFVISPLSNCAGPEKRDRFLEFIAKIAVETHDNEPKCQAYAWFRSAADNEAVPTHWLRGFEIYEDIDANNITHRDSAPYKTFRAAVAEEKLLERPSDLRFWRPTGTGFLARSGPANFSQRGEVANLQYVVVDELISKSLQKPMVMNVLAKLTDAAAIAASVESFWILHRGEGVDSDELYVFSRFNDKADWEAFETDTVKAMWRNVEGLCEWTRRTTWIDSSSGFISR